MQLEYHPKDEFKYCPFCGQQDSFIFDGKKKFKCSQCSRTFYMNAASAVGAIIETPKGILFVRRKFEPKKDMLDLPGGFVDLNENAEEAILRELKEEINFLESGKLDFFITNPNDYVFNNLLYITLDIFFHTYIENTNDLIASDDALSIEYIKPSDINIDEIGFISAKTVIKIFLDKKNIDKS